MWWEKLNSKLYSVATPFHPFGGAVDVIVVKHQDGTFRSTPWYVQFGKFQGVLKGSEKVVRISVNGVEANFHMYLDNSGEAYFVKEVDDDGVDKEVKSNGVVDDAPNSEFAREDGDVEIDGIDNSHLNMDDTHGYRLDLSISDSRVVQLSGESHSSVLPQIQEEESDADREFYEVQDGPSSFEGSAELSECGSGRYENFVDLPGSHSKVVLVRVGGQILMAPISESERNEENLQLDPQFHLGPGEATDFYESNEVFSSGENAWAADYGSQLDASSADDLSSSCNTNIDNNTSEILLEVCQREEEHNCHTEETLVVKNQDFHLQTDSEEDASCMKRENVFQSCMELHELAQQAGNADSQDADSSLEIQNLAEESNESCSTVDKNEQENIKQSSNFDKLSPVSEPISVEGSHSGAIDTEWNDEHIGKSESNDSVDDSQQTPSFETASRKSEVIEPHAATSEERDQPHSGLRFDVSLCGHELKAGMGLVAAAEVFEAHQISAEQFRSSAPSIIKNENLVVKFKERYLLWEKAAPLVLGMAVFGLDLPVEPKDTIPVEQDDAPKSRDVDTGPALSGRRWRLWPIPFRRVKTIERSSSTDEIFLDSECELQTSVVESTSTSGRQESPRKRFVKTNVPSNEMIASMNLKDGQNSVTFSFSTRVLGKQQVDAHIYLWKWNAKIVISDVDGTITKSDVLGQFMPLVGKDWSQSGVARLFSAIKENGYQLMFLSARAIVQAYLTRNFLLNLKQDGKALPNGPVVISPDGLFPALYREIIRRAPHEFKIACLEDIRRLFPSDYNPFYAGFGNRDTDELSYKKIGIPEGKIFIINPKGEVATSHCNYAKSYTSLHTLVDDMFPATLIEKEDFNPWNYWRLPLPDVDDD